MGVSWLKEAVALSAAPKLSVIARIKENLGGFVPARGYGVVHASDVTKPNFCPRHWVLMDKLQKKVKDEYLATALEATFDVGRITASLVTDKWLGKSAIGNWKCKTCGDCRTFCSKPLNGCKKLGHCHWQYVEVSFDSITYGVQGSIDVMVDLGSQLVVATELKIIKEEDFAKIIMPLPEHVLRTKLYMKLMADSNSAYKDRINLFESRVLYVSRAYGKKNLDFKGEILPFKEFVVERDDEKVMPLLRNAQQIKIYRDKGFIPSGICSLPTDNHAKNCNTCKECFSGEYPSQQKPLDML
jgi:hypothetical protein